MIRVFANGHSARVEALRAAIDAIGERLGFPAWQLQDADDARYGVWFQGDDTDTAALKTWIARDAPVLPVVETAAEAGRLPEVLESVNAFICATHGDVWPEALADELVTLAVGGRRRRRVFISYKRSDSQPIARQVCQALVERNHDVFLDDRSIAPGWAFQPALKSWMADADVVLLLGSPNFTASHWCMVEAKFATTHDIGLVVLRWPDFDDTLLQASVPEGEQVVLGEGDFEGPEDERLLTPAALERLLGRLFRSRAGLVQDRLYELSRVTQASLEGTHEVTPTKAPGAFECRRPDSDEVLRAVVVPFRPTPGTLRRVYEAGRLDGAERMVVIYDEPHDGDDPGEPLRWLARACSWPDAPRAIRMAAYDGRELEPIE